MENKFLKDYSLCKFCRRSEFASYDCMDCVGDLKLWEPSKTFAQELAKHGYKLTKMSTCPVVVICLPNCGQYEFLESIKGSKYVNNIAYYNCDVDNNIKKALFNLHTYILDKKNLIIIETMNSEMRKAIANDKFVMENSGVYTCYPCLSTLDEFLKKEGNKDESLNKIYENLIQEINKENLFFPIELVGAGSFIFSLYQITLPDKMWSNLHDIFCKYRNNKIIYGK